MIQDANNKGRLQIKNSNVLSNIYLVPDIDGTQTVVPSNNPSRNGWIIYLTDPRAFRCVITSSHKSQVIRFPFRIFDLEAQKYIDGVQGLGINPIALMPLSVQSESQKWILVEVMV